MNIKTLTINDKELLTFDSFDGTDNRATARRLLIEDDAVHHAGEGGGADITVWITSQTVNWTPPDGYRIDEVSFFDGSPSMAVSLNRCDDE